MLWLGSFLPPSVSPQKEKARKESRKENKDGTES